MLRLYTIIGQIELDIVPHSQRLKGNRTNKHNVFFLNQGLSSVFQAFVLHSWPYLSFFLRMIVDLANHTMFAICLILVFHPADNLLPSFSEARHQIVEDLE